jgi:hypothetical protein
MGQAAPSGARQPVPSQSSPRSKASPSASDDAASSRAGQASPANAAQELAELNGKMLHLLRTQSEAAFEVWRSTLSAPSVSEAIRAQSSGLRQAYEAGAAQWKEIAEATSRIFGSVLPKKK